MEAVVSDEDEHSLLHDEDSLDFMDASPVRPDVDDDDGDGPAATPAAASDFHMDIEAAVNALESSSSEDESDDEPVPGSSAVKRKKVSRKTADSFDALLGEPGTWRCLGLFATEQARDKPYMLMEAYFRGCSGVAEDAGGAAPAHEKSHQRVAVVRVTATSMLAQLVLSPLYEFRLRLEADPDRAGFFRIQDVSGPVAFSAVALGSSRTMTRQKRNEPAEQVDDPYLLQDADYRHVVTELGRSSEVVARLLRVPLTVRLLELIFARALVSGPGRLRKWYYTPDARPVDMHVVRHVHEDPLGLWKTHNALWHGMSTARRAAYTAKWCGAHFAVFEGTQVRDRWHLIRERYTVKRDFERFCAQLVLTHDASTGIDYTALMLMEEQQRRQRAHAQGSERVLPFFLSHAVAALERARVSGSGTSVLHVRPAAIHVLVHRQRTSYAESSTQLPLTMVETLGDVPFFMALLVRTSPERDSAGGPLGMFTLLNRVPRGWFETRGGVAAFVAKHADRAAQRRFDMELARLVINKRAELQMERTRSSAYYVNLGRGRLMEEVRAWLYGNAADASLTPEALADYLTGQPRSAYVRVPTGGAAGLLLVRVTDLQAMRVEFMLAHKIISLISAGEDTHEGLEVVLMPLETRTGLAHGALDALARLLQRCALGNTVVVTPYNKTRRAYALAHVIGEAQGAQAQQTLLTVERNLFCSSDQFDLNQPTVQQRASTVIVDAAHLFTAAQLFAIVAAFTDGRGLTRNLYLLGAPSVLPHCAGPGSNRGCAFYDLVRTYPRIVQPNAIDGATLASSDAHLAMLRRNDLETLQIAVTQWRTIEGDRSIFRVCEQRPSHRLVHEYKNGTRFYSLLPTGQRYTPHTSDATTLVRTHDLAVHHTGAQALDLITVYEVDWSSFLQFTLSEFITVLSHGYRIVLYGSPTSPCPWKPTADANMLSAYLTEHFRKRLYGKAALPRLTAWQALGLPKMEATMAANEAARH